MWQAATRRMPRVEYQRGTAANAPHQSAVRHNPKGEDVMQLVNAVKSFVRNEEGQDLLEYALLVALIALVAVAAVTAAGQSVSTIFQNIANALAGAA
jgi:pilus assembly protein Flp/PilA